MQATDVLVVLVTFPDREVAQSIGRRLIESRLAACVNLIPGVQSLYWWQGQVESSEEVQAIFKTTQVAWPFFEKTLLELHPYTVPEVVALRPESVTGAYATWVRQSLESLC